MIDLGASMGNADIVIKVPIDGIIGSNYFFEHKVFIDFKDKQLGFG